MQFEKTHLYHIYNRGNNSQRIFFKRENYLFFLDKIRNYILPYCDVLAWCLMPNHFHLMVEVNHVEVIVEEGSSDRMTQSHPITKTRTLNNSIAILLRSYTRAIQKQEKLNGSLFQAKIKAICLTQTEGITPAWFQSKYGTIINIVDPEKEYPQVCFNYIHMNPVNENLVANIEDWEFSSARDFVSIRNDNLVNVELVNNYGLKLGLKS